MHECEPRVPHPPRPILARGWEHDSDAATYYPYLPTFRNCHPERSEEASRRTQSKDLRFAGGGRMSPSRRTAGPSTRAEVLGRDDNSIKRQRTSRDADYPLPNHHNTAAPTTIR